MRRSAGFSIAELLVLVAIIGIAAGTAALYVKPMQTTTKDGAIQVAEFFRMTRFRAMATTSAYRARATSSRTLIGETAASCTATTWTTDAALTTNLPANVTLGSTTWSACFNSRGISSQNFTVTVIQPGRPTRTVEVLLGGLSRVLL